MVFELNRGHTPHIFKTVINLSSQLIGFSNKKNLNKQRSVFNETVDDCEQISVTKKLEQFLITIVTNIFVSSKFV